MSEKQLRPKMRSIDTAILDHRDLHVAEKILAVQRAAYRQEDILLRVERFPPLDREVAEILCSEDRFFGAWIDGVIAGVASVESGNDQVHACISSMTVAPNYQRRGVASALMSRLLQEVGAVPLTVSTGMLNKPALALYSAFGFAAVKYWRLDEFNLELVELRLDYRPSAAQS